MATIKIKDADLTDRYYAVTGEGTTVNPYQNVAPSFEISHAINEVFSTYGDVVSVWEKAKSLREFGRNATVGTSFETIAEFQGTTANETFVTTNIVDSIVSSSSSDTSQTIVIEGHTVDGSGNLTFVSQEAVLTGQTEVTLTTPLARVTRAYVKSSGTFGTTPAALVGTVYIYDNTGGISSGVPVTPAATKITISAGQTQSQKCATSISSTDYYFIENFAADIGVTGGSAVRVECLIEIRDIFNGGVWRPIGRNIELTVGQNGVVQKFNPLLIVPKNHDIRVVAKTNANTAEVTAQFSGYLAIVT